jgi:hypothetical protein
VQDLVNKTIREAKHANASLVPNVQEKIAHSVILMVKAIRWPNLIQIALSHKTTPRDSRENVNSVQIALGLTVLSATLKAKDNSLPSLVDKTTKVIKSLHRKNLMSSANKLSPFTNLPAALVTSLASESTS